MFKRAYIPRTLNEVTHYERDVDTMLRKKEENSSEDTLSENVRLAALNEQWSNGVKMEKSGWNDGFPLQILYQTVTGLRKDLSGVQTVSLFLKRPFGILKIKL